MHEDIRRWNFKAEDGSDEIQICRGNHARHEDCIWERYVPASRAGKMPKPYPRTVLVLFGEGTPADVKGPGLLAFEADLRRRGAKVEVFQETMRDQNKARRDLTRDDVI